MIVLHSCHNRDALICRCPASQSILLIRRIFRKKRRTCIVAVVRLSSLLQARRSILGIFPAKGRRMHHVCSIRRQRSIRQLAQLVDSLLRVTPPPQNTPCAVQIQPPNGMRLSRSAERGSEATERSAVSLKRKLGGHYSCSKAACGRKASNLCNKSGTSLVAVLHTSSQSTMSYPCIK